jgi:hypothetical protein
MKPSVFCTQFLRLPLDDETIDDCWPLADRLERAFDHAQTGALCQVSAWLARRPIRYRDLGPFQVEQLEHELSDYMAMAVSDAPSDGRSMVEFEVMKQLPPIESIGGEDALVELLLQLDRLLCGSSDGFRREDIQTRPDYLGNCVRYPSPEEIGPSLRRLYGHWREYAAVKPGLAAVVILAAVTNLHPFQDGNGRVARVLFNHLLNTARHEPIYLPIHEIAALSRGGFLIRLRQAQYYGEWRPLFGFLAQCAETLFASVRSM